MELKATRYEIDDAGVATVWLHRPERANAYTARMAFEYRWIFEQLAANPAVRVAVVTGSGKAFSVGADSAGLAASVERGAYETELPAGIPSQGMASIPSSITISRRSVRFWPGHGYQTRLRMTMRYSEK